MAYPTQEQIDIAQARAYRNKLRSYQRAQERKTNPKFSVNERMQLVRMSNRQKNSLRWHANETEEHIQKKLEICMKLKREEHEFITEAIFTNGTRCDILDLTDGIIYEILCTETDEQFNKKLKTYPQAFKLEKIRIKSEN